MHHARSARKAGVVDCTSKVHHADSNGIITCGRACVVIRNSDKEWQKFTRKEPFHSGGIDLEKFRHDKLEKESVHEFFATGRDQIEYILTTIRERISPGFFPSRALDFGCGVGRIVIPLADVCPVVVGVDVSDTVMEEARNICNGRSLTKIEFYKSDDDLSEVPGNFDLIHSSFTFQHIALKRGEKILKRFVELLSDDGVGVVDLLIHRDVPKYIHVLGSVRKQVPFFHNLANLLEGKPFFEPYAEKNVYDINRIVTMLYENGCGNLHLRLFRNGNHMDAFLFFQKKRDPVVPHEAFYNR